MTSSTSAPLLIAPPPWKCKATAYVLSWYNSASAGLPLDIAYDPLEARDPSFSSEGNAGTYKGGLCMAQILRYSETPVGTYDELAILPGFWTGVGAEGSKKKDSRITGIWVSQETALMNGRRNWNIPKFAIYLPKGMDKNLISILIGTSRASYSLPRTLHRQTSRLKSSAPIPLRLDHSSQRRSSLSTIPPPSHSIALG